MTKTIRIQRYFTQCISNAVSPLSWLSSVFLILSASLLWRLSSVSSISESCILSSMDVKKWPAESGWSLLWSLGWETLRCHSNAATWAQHPTSRHPEIQVQKSASYGSLGIDVELYSGNVTFIAGMTRHKMSSNEVSALITEFNDKFEFVLSMMGSFEICSNIRFRLLNLITFWREFSWAI